MALTYIQDEMGKVGFELKKARHDLATFKVNNEISGNSDILDQNISQLAQLRAQAGEAERSAMVANSLKITLADRLHKESPVKTTEVTEEQNPLLSKLDADIYDLETRRLELRAEFAADSPEVKNVEDQIREAQARRKSFPGTRSAGRKNTVNPVYQQLNEQYVNAVSDSVTQQARLTALQKEINKLSGRLIQTAPAEVQTTEMNNRVAQLQETYDLLSRNYQTLRLNAASQISNIRILSQAVENQNPVNRNMTRALILSLAIGILLAVALTMMAELFDRRIHTERSLENIVYRPVLAQIPQMQPTGIQLTGNMLESSPVLEQMRLLRSILVARTKRGRLSYFRRYQFGGAGRQEHDGAEPGDHDGAGRQARSAGRCRLTPSLTAYGTRIEQRKRPDQCAQRQGYAGRCAGAGTDSKYHAAAGRSSDAQFPGTAQCAGDTSPDQTAYRACRYRHRRHPAGDRLERCIEFAAGHRWVAGGRIGFANESRCAAGYVAKSRTRWRDDSRVRLQSCQALQQYLPELLLLRSQRKGQETP